MPVDNDGVVDLEVLKSALAKAERPLVSVMLANNETGAIQPIAEIATIVHAANGLLHVDAVQGAGRIDCDIEALGADLLSLSSHQARRPAGRRQLVRRRYPSSVAPLIRGGGAGAQFARRHRMTTPSAVPIGRLGYPRHPGEGRGHCRGSQRPFRMRSRPLRRDEWEAAFQAAGTFATISIGTD